MRYVINILTLRGITLTFTVSNYNVKDGFVEFIDEKTRRPKKFHGSRCEIEEINSGANSHV